jgi:nitrite reductase (NADH) small subunit
LEYDEMNQAEKFMTGQVEWVQIGRVEDIPKLGARVVRTAEGDIAVFRTADDGIFALRDKCPHKGGPLSQGIVSGRRVACPLHDWKIDLDSGNAVAPDEGCAARFPVQVEGGVIQLSLTPDEGCPNK